jgi:aspartate/methionine/tyrosine aminotransferase
VSLTTPHNPTGSMLSPDELRKIVALVESRGAYLLCDETYREMSFDKVLPVAASLSERAISVSSLSKTYGLPGIRMGWLLTRDRRLQETFLAAKEQIMVCNSVVDEEIAFRFLQKKESFLRATFEMIRAHFQIVKDFMTRGAGAEFLEWVEPQGGVVCFPRIRSDAGVNVEAFYRILGGEHSTFVGPGHWFEMDRRYMRIGYGWPKTAELREGLSNLALALKSARG